MRTGRAAPRCRAVDNWVRVVDSFTGSADTLYNNMMKDDRRPEVSLGLE